MVRFGRTVVLEKVDITVPEGRVITLIGPNGAGKTTLIRVLLGLAVADAGVIRRRSGLRIGYVPQRLHVDPILPLKVRRFLGLVQERRQIGPVLEELAIAHLVDKPVQRLSGGEMQRVLLARALLGKPDLLVLDEPAQSVDVGGQSELYALIGRLRDHRGCGVLLVSHDLHLVMVETDHVICLNRHVCCAGTPALVSQQPEYVAMFGQEAVRNIALYHHHHAHQHSLDGSIHFTPEDVTRSSAAPPEGNGFIHG
ncbi:Zinc ABC transporter, ATP-binding protein ZnuC [invertebrate metagenome]|uniref:Zinc ABC transporter, ATP-binding protein ZnuC n=1 Tax=invertebrate metagenome TaxID=1711999 RepID=A0A484H941_9ZZZZ